MSSGDTQRRQLLEQLIRGQIDQATYERRLAALERGPAGPPMPGGAGKPLPGGAPGRPGGTPSAAPPTGPVRGADEVIRSGELLDRRFKVRDRLGKGGMGEVWRAYDTIADVQVVVKVLPRALQNDPQEIARVQQAFRRVNPLQHQHICPVHHLAHDPQAGYFLVMKYIEGTTLRDYLRSQTRDGRLSVADVGRILKPVAEALDYAHAAGVVHRDIKPDNIMLGRDGSDPQIVDFGLAADAQAAGSVSGAVDRGGTLPYLAPEQWQKQHAGPHSDQYALGVMAYELLSGRLPFADRDPRLLKQQVLTAPVPLLPGGSVEIQRALGRALAKSPRDRYPTCVEFIRGLEGARAPSLPPTPAGPPAGPAPLGGGPQPPPPVLTTPTPPAPAAGKGHSSADFPMLPQPAPPRPPLAVRPPSRLSSQELPLLPVAAAEPASTPTAIVPAPPAEPVSAKSGGGWGRWLATLALITLIVVGRTWLSRQFSSSPAGRSSSEPDARGVAAVPPADVSAGRPDSVASSASTRPAPQTTDEAPPAPTTVTEPQPEVAPPAPPAPTPQPAPPAPLNSSTRLVLGRSQLLNVFVPLGLTIDWLRTAQVRATHGQGRVQLDAAGLVQGITYGGWSANTTEDELQVQFDVPGKATYVLRVHLGIDPVQGPIVRSSTLRISGVDAPDPPPSTAGNAAAPPAAPAAAAPPATLASTWGPLRRPLSSVLDQLRPVVQPLAGEGNPWIAAAPYTDDDGASRLQFALYAPVESSLALRTAEQSAMIVEYSQLLASQRDWLEVRPGNTGSRLICTRPGRTPPEVTSMLNRCLLRIAGRDDAVVLCQPLLDNSDRLRIYWKTSHDIAVPTGTPPGLHWRMFLSLRAWNASGVDWVEVARVRNQDPSSQKFIYDGYEPADWERKFGAWEFAVHLKDLTFVAEPVGDPGSPARFSFSVQGVPSGWIESYRLKKAAVARAEPAAQRQLRHELQILDGLMSERGEGIGPGSGFAACLVGYETLEGPRTIPSAGGSAERSDRVDVARCVLGLAASSLNPRMLVRPGGPAEVRR